jgi:ribonuclease T2
VKIPEEFLQLSEQKPSPRAISRLPSSRSTRLSSSAISVTCSAGPEVRVCLSKDMQFRACDEIDRRACRRDEVVMPPVRGG